MYPSRSFFRILTFVLCFALAPSFVGQAQDSVADFLDGFRDPDAWYHTGPLWVWNDRVSEETIVQQLDMFRAQGILQPFVHPRPGLMTPYLSEEWLDLYEFAVHAAKERGMLLHIYDENSYPSGFAGGHVPSRHPEWGGKGIAMDKMETLPDPLPEHTLAVYRVEDEAFVPLDLETPSGAGPFALARLKFTEPKAWNGGYPYVDLLEPGLTEEFLEITYEPYRKRFGEEFGKTVRGAFTDEPHLKPAGSLHWTPRFPKLFEERYGYSFLDTLPSLFEDTGDFRRVRFDCYELLLDEFIDRWAKPYFEYCEKNNLLATGHFWEHGWPTPTYGPDTMAMYAWQQMPAIDCLMNRYSEGVHAQFGNLRAVKELASVANQMGRERRLCEVYGAGGWEMTFRDQKRIADWLGVLGVNLFNQHLSYMTLRGARKRDHPLSFADHAPWWEHYRPLAKYLARFSYALSKGEERNRILVLEPTTSAWLLYRAGGDNGELEAMGESFQAFITNLSLNQVEYDLASERILHDRGSIEGNQVRVGERDYDLLVLHETCTNLTEKTAVLIDDFYEADGNVLYVGGEPRWVDGREEEFIPAGLEISGALLVSKAGKQTKAFANEEEATSYLHDGFSKARFSELEGGKLFHQYRSLGDGEKEGVLLLCNTGADENAGGVWSAKGNGVRVLDLLTGNVDAVPFGAEDGRVEVAFDLPPAGSVAYLISEETIQPPRLSNPKEKPLTLDLKSIRPAEPNALIIDFCDYRAGEREGKNVYFYTAQTEIYREHGFDRNPWDSAVQFEDRLLKRDDDFDDTTGFSVTYRFRVEGFERPPALEVVVEQGDRYTLHLNGEQLDPTEDWWLDRKFARLAGGDAIRLGTNELTIAAKPFSVHHEVEPIYILGEFSLKNRETGWTIQPPTSLEYGPWKDQGYPFYPNGVRYEYGAIVDDPAKTHRLRLTDWEGTVAAVSVNGEQAGQIGWPPYELDLTGLKKGENHVTVEPIGSLKNLLGPHHGDPEPGAAWPSAFKRGPDTGPPPGDTYSTFDYGLMTAPELVEETE